MSTNYLEKLEFNKILFEVSNFCCTFIGKSIALSLLPSNEKSLVSSMLSETRRRNQLNI